jgi:multidrug efflux pump subunit AcrA (membrane-fusion protein)
MTIGRGFRITGVVVCGVLAAIVVVRLARPGAPRVSVARAELGMLTSWIMTNGMVEPVTSDVARAHVATFVTGVFVAEGQMVEPGDLMVTLDVGSQRADLAHQREALTRAENGLRTLETIGQSGDIAQVEAQLRSADADLDHLTQQRAGTVRLIEKQAATREELDQIDLALARASAARTVLAQKKETLERSTAMDLPAATLAVQQARDGVRVAEALVEWGRVRASVRGTVYALPARSGVRVDEGAVLAEVADLRALQVRAFVDESDLATIALDHQVEISWNAVPGRIWTGRTIRVPNSVAQRGDRRVGAVICSVDHSAPPLIPNLDVDVRILVRSEPQALLVPRAAVRTGRSQRYLFVVQDGVAHRRAIDIDGANSASYAIARGLTDGESVAVQSSIELQDGMRVDPVTP